MRGEDLTQLFDGVDRTTCPTAPFSITLQRLADHRRATRAGCCSADREQMERRLYDDDEEADDDEIKKRYDDVASDAPGQLTDMSRPR